MCDVSVPREAPHIKGLRYAGASYSNSLNPKPYTFKGLRFRVGGWIRYRLNDSSSYAGCSAMCGNLEACVS